MRLAYAAGLTTEEFRAFASVLTFEGRTGSRFALEEQVLQAIAEWTDLDIRGMVTGLMVFIRRKMMMPDAAGELITRESVLLQLGTSDGTTLFPCPSEVVATENPVSRSPVREAIGSLRSGVQYLCLHGRAGVGKTTALQEIEAGLPPGSIMLKYDCYGGGRYMDPSELRHRPADAFLQLTNELSARLRLPLFISRQHGSDYPRVFAKRLARAAGALAAKSLGALIVIAIDAADNAIVAAQNREPVEMCFVRDFVLLSKIPENVRFIVTARTGSLDDLPLPSRYSVMEIEPFSQPETADNVAHMWSAPQSWVEDFHYLSGGDPRLQAYAFKVDGEHPSAALDRLRPTGKTLDEIFRQQFNDALSKGGVRTKVTKLCAALIALPRPVPLPDLAAVLATTKAKLVDVCLDLAPGIRFQDDTVGFADEDFENFIRTEAQDELPDVQKSAARRLLAQADQDPYAALNVAAALVAADQGADLLELVEREPAPSAVNDPILRREAELQRLHLAIKVCRNAGDVPRALRFVLMGAEGINTEATLCDLLTDSPDVAARFAPETARRLILSDPDHIEDYGPFLFHKLSIDAEQGDAISFREGQRSLHAWLQAREQHKDQEWKISISDISSQVEATLKLHGSAAALQDLARWRPKHVALEVALTLPYRLVAKGHGSELVKLIGSDHLGPIGSLFLLIPLALAGQPIDVDQMARGLEGLFRRKLRLKRFFHAYVDGLPSIHGEVLDAALTACEILTIHGAAPDLVDKILASFLQPALRRIDRRRPRGAFELDLIFRAYTLSETRAGRAPSAENVFVPPDLPGKDEKRRKLRAERQNHGLTETTKTFFGIYALVAQAFVNTLSATEFEDQLRDVCDTLEREPWRISPEHAARPLRGHAAKNLATLLAAGHAPLKINSLATRVHGGWKSGHDAPNKGLISRLSLWPELHGSLVDNLAAVADETRSMRMGARDKCEVLVGYARHVTPLSEPDATAIFNYAVEAARDLDQEIMAQIPLLHRLVRRGTSNFSDARYTARQFSDIVADAAVRLDGYDYFPWDDAMAALARLDAPLALANVARWHDEGIARHRESLIPTLKAALATQTIRPEQAAALILLLDYDGGVMVEALKQSKHRENPAFAALVEEAAYDVLVRDGLRVDTEIVQCLEQNKSHGPWSHALLRRQSFLANLTPTSTRDSQITTEPDLRTDDLLGKHPWKHETLVDSERLGEAVNELANRERAGNRHLPLSAIFDSARREVSPQDRFRHLEVLAELSGPTIADDAVDSLRRAINEWWKSPSVRDWCRTKLPEVIVLRLPELTRHLPYGVDEITSVLEKTGLSDIELQKIMLRGVERHVDVFKPERLFALTALIGSKLAPSEAAGLADWYTKRLAERIPDEDRDQIVPLTALPQQIDEAVARFLFAYMGDWDLRLRWRAVHAVRRLARIGDEATLTTLVAEYHRREEPVFRGRDLAFYWLAARLWFVLAWDRVASECPELARCAAQTLLDVALDESFPHVLVRSFARDACEKLTTGGLLSLSDSKYSRLRSVNETTLPQVPGTTIPRNAAFDGDFGQGEEARRFKFDWLDTIRYWYEPLLETFADVDGEHFLQEVERWIIDVWGYDGDIRAFDKERRRERFGSDWRLMRHGHGSKPTLERLNNHLEWHAMWCATGELLKTNPLASQDQYHWRTLPDRIKDEKLVEPPLWSADLLVPTPLDARNWEPDKSALNAWVSEVNELAHRAEAFPSDSPDCVVVDGSSERRMEDRTERTRISSALVEPSTGGSLLRALQTMDDSWDYKLPDEGEDHEIEQTPYRLLGWLWCSSKDSAIDEKDPLRGSAFNISSRPGNRVITACNLIRDAAGRAIWTNVNAARPMFVYEAWGKPETDGDRLYTDGVAGAGERLKVDKEQLLNFLRGQELDLIIEVEVTRRGRETRGYPDEKRKSPEARFARLYRLDSRGGLEIAEGHLGTWTGYRPTA